MGMNGTQDPSLLWDSRNRSAFVSGARDEPRLRRTGCGLGFDDLKQAPSQPDASPHEQHKRERDQRQAPTPVNRAISHENSYLVQERRISPIEVDDILGRLHGYG